MSGYEDDLDYCMEMHDEVSRTFSLALRQLSGDLEEFVAVSYNMCRIPDTIEDSEVIPEDEKRTLINMYRSVLENKDNVQEFIDMAAQYRDDALEAGEEEAYWNLLANTDRVINVYDQFDGFLQSSIQENVGEMVEGMKETVKDDEIRLKSENEFEEYCFYVAGTVGNLLTEIFSQHDRIGKDTTEKLKEYADAFGEGLQTVNIIKDVKEDYLEEDAVFVPESVLEEYGLDHDDLETLLDPDEESDLNAEDFEDPMRDMVNRAEERMNEALNYIEALFEMEDQDEKLNEIRDWTMTPFMLAQATLREADENILEPLEEGGVKISRVEAATITEKVPEWRKEQQNSEDLEALEKRSQRVYGVPHESSALGLLMELDDMRERTASKRDEVLFE